MEIKFKSKSKLKFKLRLKLHPKPTKVTFQQLIKNHSTVLVDFFATWCGPCQAMNPILKEVVRRTDDQIKVVKIDIDKNSNLANQLNIRSVPTLLLYHQGELQWRHSGMYSADGLVQHIIKAANN